MNSTAQTEYEYFLFKQVYGDKKTFVDAAWDAVKGTNVVQVFTTGNRDLPTLTIARCTRIFPPKQNGTGLQ